MSLKKKVSQLLYTAAKATWENRRGKCGEVVVLYDDFSGLRGIDISGLPEGTISGMNADGIGTKVELAERQKRFSTLAYDLFAMVCDDAVAKGAEPINIVSVLDARLLTDDFLPQVEQLAAGYIAAAREAGVAVVNGETAELRSRVGGYGDFNFNWSATLLWLARKERLLTGKEIVPGDAIVALREEGFRSNGLTSARAIFSSTYGEAWHNTYFDGRSLGDHLLLPSRIYTPAIVAMTGGFVGTPRAVIHGIAHITGDGIPEKLGRTLKPSGYGAVLDSLFQPCSAMWLAQCASSVMDDVAYRTWNMGQGMLVVTPEPSEVLGIAVDYGIEAKVVGRVVEEKGIALVSNGLFGNGKELRF
ncbi:hypothetical protein HYT55_01355 [Candidatus Woesearchaeota archaeon]|nr:hypothetical protein [Candidatus Woesearchaeota archaeon]